MIREELSREMMAGINKLHTLAPEDKITTEQAVRDMKSFGEIRCLEHRTGPLRYKVSGGDLYYWNYDICDWWPSCHDVGWLEKEYKDERWVK